MINGINHFSMGVHSHGGTPIAGWFMENREKNEQFFGGITILGNPQRIFRNGGLMGLNGDSMKQMNIMGCITN